MGLNLHRMARAAVSAAHPDEVLLLYRSLGHANVKGALVPRFAAAVPVQAQVQNQSDAALFFSGQTGQSSISRKAYLCATPANRPMSLNRDFARGGDMIQREDGTWWLVTSEPEDFSKSGWVSIVITQQVKGLDHEMIEAEVVDHEMIEAEIIEPALVEFETIESALSEPELNEPQNIEVAACEIEGAPCVPFQMNTPVQGVNTDLPLAHKAQEHEAQKHEAHEHGAYTHEGVRYE